MSKDFQCDKCKKQFKTKQNLQYHLNKGSCSIITFCNICNTLYKTEGGFKRHMHKMHQIPAEPAQILEEPAKILEKTAQILEEPTKILEKTAQVLEEPAHDKKTCKYCFLQFTREDSVKRHIDKYCKIKKEIELKNKNEEADEKLIKIKEINNTDSYNTNNINNTNTNSLNTNNTNNTNNINNISFTLNTYKEENLSYITDKDFLRCFNKGMGSLEEYLILKHYNKDHQENSNLYISDLKSKYCLYYNGNEFIKENFSDMISYIIDDNLYELDEKRDELNELDEFDELTEKEIYKAIKKYDEFIKKYNDKYCKEYKDILKYLINTVKMLLYNKRAMPSAMNSLKKSIDKKNNMDLIKKYFL